MRNFSRINQFCDELKAIWDNVPDWRFGQLMLNIERFCRITYDKDMFYIEDDELMNMMKEYFKENGSGY